jgi:hypothetical protein
MSAVAVVFTCLWMWRVVQWGGVTLPYIKVWFDAMGALFLVVGLIGWAIVGLWRLTAPKP